MWDKLQHEMYWNRVIQHAEPATSLDKLQHEMYWNSRNILRPSLENTDKLQHEMYWNICLMLLRKYRQ